MQRAAHEMLMQYINVHFKKTRWCKQISTELLKYSSLQVPLGIKIMDYFSHLNTDLFLFTHFHSSSLWT